MVGIVVNTRVYGTHSWPGVTEVPGLEAVYFLKNEHLHNFHIKCKRVVKHADRDIEIIDFKKQIDDYFYEYYHSESKGYCVFGHMSCEMIATELAEMLNLDYVEVLEDGNFGGFYEKD
jgi:coproporphyrinogen III oxidase